MGPDVWGIGTGQDVWDKGDTISTVIILWSFFYNSSVKFYDKIGDPQHDRIISKSVV